jgi:predicted TIM-barrel enzyme
MQHTRWAPPDRPFLLGAAIGSGLVARAAERGGADFVLALNAGQIRERGLPSVASSLPLGETNADMIRIAGRDIAAQIDVPVYAGLTVFGPPARLADDLSALVASEVTGVVNFPTVVHYSGEVRRSLDAAGWGFAAEMDMLAEAARRGLSTLAYVTTEAEARAAARIAPDMICINFGWNAGGRLTELVPDVSLNEAILRARTIARRLAREVPGTPVLIEGGPVVNPRQVAEICAEAGTQGYVGGSTLDRLPIEDAVYDRALAFKSAARARRPGRLQDARLRGVAEAAGLVGTSEALEDVLTRLARGAEGGGHLLISGPPGTQRHAAARVWLALAGREGRVSILDAEEQPAFETGVRLFGRGSARAGLLEQADGGALQIEPLRALEPRWQRKLARFLDRGSYTRYRGRAALAPRPMLVVLSDMPIAALAARGRIVPDLAARLAPCEIVMPGLSERREDVPDIVDWLIGRARGGFELGPSGLGLLMRAELPRHVSDLRHLVDALVASGARGTLGAVDLEPILTLPGSAAGDDDSRVAERAWILDTLRRHAFNRTAAAREMGVARKTLYNRMKRHGL